MNSLVTVRIVSVYAARLSDKTMETKMKRIASYDCTRALCMLWIVSLWHMQYYLDISIKCYITDDICLGVLASFTFISGLFLGGKPVKDLYDAIGFYKNRLLRIYPLFLFSCIMFYLLLKHYKADFINGKQQLILTAAGLSSLFPPEQKTIWYISMIIMFYVLTPFINAAERACKKIIVSSLKKIR